MDTDANDNSAPFGIKGYTSSTYGDSFADVYDNWYGSLDDDDFIDYISALLPDRPAKVLELGVGTGRLLDKLRSTRPHRDILHGIDSSQSMLDHVRERQDLSDAILTTGDFSTTLPADTFDVIFVGYNTLFNLPDDESLDSCLSLVATRLAPMGIFAIDVVVPEPADSPDIVSIKSLRNDGVTLSVSRHDHDSQRITGQFIDITSADGVVLRPWSVRYWTPPQLDTHACKAGLALVERVAHGDGTTHHDDDARHISTYKCQKSPA